MLDKAINNTINENPVEFSKNMESIVTDKLKVKVNETINEIEKKLFINKSK